MANRIQLAQHRQHKNTQVIALLYSIIFVVTIGFGYYLLLQKNPFVAFIVGLVLASLAWSLARFLASTDDGIKRYPPLFVLLLLISAVGIFNTLMLNLEGRQIFQETIDETAGRYETLQSDAEKILKNNVAEKKVGEVNQLLELLVGEINNPVDCGQGPKARSYVDLLQAKLDNFRGIYGTNSPCSRSKELSERYRELVATLLAKQSWYVQENYAQLLSDQLRLRENVEASGVELRRLKQVALDGFAPKLLKSVSPALESLNASYMDDRSVLTRYSKEVHAPATLDLSSVRNLGEWSQLINLIIDRLNKPTTYVYLLLAVFLDWLMVYLLRLVRINSPRVPLPDEVAIGLSDRFSGGF